MWREDLRKIEKLPILETPFIGTDLLEYLEDGELALIHGESKESMDLKMYLERISRDKN